MKIRWNTAVNNYQTRTIKELKNGALMSFIMAISCWIVAILIITANGKLFDDSVDLFFLLGTGGFILFSLGQEYNIIRQIKEFERDRDK